MLNYTESSNVYNMTDPSVLSSFISISISAVLFVVYHYRSARFRKSLSNFRNDFYGKQKLTIIVLYLIDLTLYNYRLSYQKESVMYNTITNISVIFYDLLAGFVSINFSLRYLKFILFEKAPLYSFIFMLTLFMLNTVFIIFTRFVQHGTEVSSLSETIGVVLNLIWELNNSYYFYICLNQSKKSNSKITRTIKISLIISLLMIFGTLINVIIFIKLGEDSLVSRVLTPISCTILLLSPFSLYMIEYRSDLLARVDDNTFIVDSEITNNEETMTFQVLKSPNMSTILKFRSPN